MISRSAIWHNGTGERRESQNTHKSLALWFTGLSGAGKSTFAHAVEEKLHQRNYRTFILDGGNVRHGVNMVFSHNLFVVSLMRYSTRNQIHK